MFQIKRREKRRRVKGKNKGVIYNGNFKIHKFKGIYIKFYIKFI